MDASVNFVTLKMTSCINNPQIQTKILYGFFKFILKKKRNNFDLNKFKSSQKQQDIIYERPQHLDIPNLPKTISLLSPPHKFPTSICHQKLSCSLLISKLIFKSPQTYHPPKFAKEGNNYPRNISKNKKIIQVKEALALLPRMKKQQQEEDLIFRSCAFRIISLGRNISFHLSKADFVLFTA